MSNNKSLKILIYIYKTRTHGYIIIFSPFVSSQLHNLWYSQIHNMNKEKLISPSMSPYSQPYSHKRKHAQTKHIPVQVISHENTQKNKKNTCPLILHSLFIILLFTLLLRSSCILVLLILWHQIIHITFSLCELHLIHSFPSVPM